MKIYQVILTKSYIVKIRAGSGQKAKRIAEFYTDDIKDISTTEDRKKLNFSIEKIECGVNESLEAKRIE